MKSNLIITFSALLFISSSEAAFSASRPSANHQNAQPQASFDLWSSIDVAQLGFALVDHCLAGTLDNTAALTSLITFLRFERIPLRVNGRTTTVSEFFHADKTKRFLKKIIKDRGRGIAFTQQNMRKYSNLLKDSLSREAIVREFGRNGVANGIMTSLDQIPQGDNITISEFLDWVELVLTNLKCFNPELLSAVQRDGIKHLLELGYNKDDETFFTILGLARSPNYRDAFVRVKEAEAQLIAAQRRLNSTILIGTTLLAFALFQAPEEPQIALVTGTLCLTVIGIALSYVEKAKAHVLIKKSLWAEERANALANQRMHNQVEHLRNALRASEEVQGQLLRDRDEVALQDSYRRGILESELAQSRSLLRVQQRIAQDQAAKITALEADLKKVMQSLVDADGEYAKASEELERSKDERERLARQSAADNSARRTAEENAAEERAQFAALTERNRQAQLAEQLATQQRLANEQAAADNLARLRAVEAQRRQQIQQASQRRTAVLKRGKCK